MGLIEVLSTLARKRKARELGLAALREKSREAKRDFSLFHQIYLTPELLKLARKLPEKYALRSAGTVHLASIILLRRHVATADMEVRMVTCDTELETATRDSGFIVINPDKEGKQEARQQQ